MSDQLISGLKEEGAIDDYFVEYSSSLEREDKNQLQGGNIIDEYFIDTKTGDELAEWEDLTDKDVESSDLSFWDKMTAAREDDKNSSMFDNLETPKGQLIKELADNSIIQDKLNGRIIKVPKNHGGRNYHLCQFQKSKIGRFNKSKKKMNYY